MKAIEDILKMFLDAGHEGIPVDKEYETLVLKMPAWITNDILLAILHTLRYAKLLGVIEETGATAITGYGMLRLANADYGVSIDTVNWMTESCFPKRNRHA